MSENEDTCLQDAMKHMNNGGNTVYQDMKSGWQHTLNKQQPWQKALKGNQQSLLALLCFLLIALSISVSIMFTLCQIWKFSVCDEGVKPFCGPNINRELVVESGQPAVGIL